LRLHQHVDLVILQLLRVIARAKLLIEILMTKPRVILSQSLGDELRHATPHLTRIALHPRIRRQRSLAEQTLQGLAHRATFASATADESFTSFQSIRTHSSAHGVASTVAIDARVGSEDARGISAAHSRANSRRERRARSREGDECRIRLKSPRPNRR
tara:strand:- start:1460 stop:1933 length:474 start_codon:yes stop_codon:yes gene_type:complete